VFGKISSHYYIKYPSIATYNEHLKPNMGLIELFKLFSLSSEFKFIPIREEEKSELQKLIQSVPVPIKGSVEDPTTKVNILLQSYVSKLKLSGYALNSDMVYITQSAGRIMRGILEIALKRGWAQIALLALNASKMIERQMWSCMTPLRQFKNIPEEIFKRIEKKEQFTWDHYYNMSAQQIGDLIRYPKIGKTLHKLIHQVPRVELEAQIQPITRSTLKIDLKITPDFQWDEKVHGKNETFWIFVLDCDGEMILYSEFFAIKRKHLG
jgi:pre-mRNA-splicing helicase BRR2